MAMRLAIEFVAENCPCHAGRWWIPRTQQRGYSRAPQTPSRWLLGADHRTTYTTTSHGPPTQGMVVGDLVETVEHAF